MENNYHYIDTELKYTNNKGFRFFAKNSLLLISRCLRIGLDKSEL